jgi:hypothetical protein
MSYFLAGFGLTVDRDRRIFKHNGNLYKSYIFCRRRILVIHGVPYVRTCSAQVRMYWRVDCQGDTLTYTVLSFYIAFVLGARKRFIIPNLLDLHVSPRSLALVFEH